MYSISDISAAINAKVIGNSNLVGDFQLLTDSRSLTNSSNSIFFALQTTYNNGHKYIPDLIDKGVKIFVVENGYECPQEESLCFLKVEQPLNALQKLAKFHREHFQIPIIGITGSNGKTIVKEWLSILLEKNFTICANPKSYNSQIGVPLSVWQLNDKHNLGIFEAGISTVNEMEHLSQIIQANIGVLTHLGTAHNEGFDNPNQKLKEKLKLFERCEKIYTIYNVDTVQYLEDKAICFGYNEPKAKLNITLINKSNSSTQIEAIYQEKPISFHIPFTDEASIENACLCCLVCNDLNCFDSERFNLLKPISMRMELKKGIHSCILVNDSYSNDINSLSNALSFLVQQSIHHKSSVILSDIEGSGLPSNILYQQVKNLLINKNIKRIIGIGQEFINCKGLFENDFESIFYSNTQAFLDDFYQLKFWEESILVKGARKFEFEKIVNKLEQENHGTVLEINLSAASNNLKAIKSKLPIQTKIMAMVKAFAYGSGSYEIAKLLQNKVEYLAVAYVDEGIALRKSGIQTPIMVMNTDENALDALIEYQLEPVIFSVKQLKNFESLKADNYVKIHIEVDTGMHRLGFMENEIDNLLNELSNSSRFKVASIFSHLAGSDESQFDEFTLDQMKNFKRIAQKIELSINYTCIKHISNTAATLRFKQNEFDMVRLGIGLYGIDPSQQFKQILEPVFTLKSHISQIKKIDANESIGYSRKSISNHERKIAVLALGYADGLNRALSNGIGGFWINGKLAKIAGNICMDMCMVDVTDINCEVGDEAILFGKEYPIDEIAKQLNTIPYEILTSISQRVKRIYVSE